MKREVGQSGFLNSLGERPGHYVRVDTRTIGMGKDVSGGGPSVCHFRLLGDLFSGQRAFDLCATAILPTKSG